ncbi:MAG: PAS domain S-box protein [Magnetococcales bacterium]|nr:PAS domain S-box protein [Magnetococcales bacterium]
MELTFNRKFMLLGLILLIVSMVVGGITIWTLYTTHLEDVRDRLIDIVQSRARFMESLAAFDQQHSPDYPGGSQEATLAQIRQAHDRFKGFGETGEFTVGRREGDRIVFMVRHRHSDFDKPQPVPLPSRLAIPMQRALSGQSGSVVGLDYRGVEVLAAYEPVAILNMGVVVKVDMEEVRSRYIQAALLLFALACGIVAVGELLFYWISKPLIRRIVEHQQLGRILESSVNEIYIFDVDFFRCVYVNNSAQVNLGYTSAELSMLYPWSFNPLMSENAFKERVQPLLRGDKLQLFFETEHRRRDGSVYPVEVRMQLFQQEKIQVVVSIVLDVSTRKSLERSLYETETNHFITLQSIGDAVISTDTRRRVQYMNPVAETLTGWKLDEARNRPLSEVFRMVNSQTGLPVVNPVETVLETGTLVGLASHATLVARDGRESQIADSCSPIRDAGGTLLGVVLVFRDVTEEYRMRAALQTSEERLQLVLDGTNDGIWDWNIRSGAIYFSPKAEQMLGFAHGELVPHFQSWVDLLHPDDRERVLSGLDDHVAGRIESHSLEYRLRTRMGDWVWIQGRGKVVERDAEGKPWRMAGTYTDITVRKGAEMELQRMNRALKALSSASEALLHAQDEEQFMTTLCQLIVEKAGYRLAWCGFSGQDATQRVVPVAQFGYEIGYLDSLYISWGEGASGQGPTGRAIRTGLPAHARDILNDPDFAPWREQAMAQGYRSSVSLPLVSEGQPFGALSVYAAEPDAFDGRETAFLMDLARDISFGIMALRAHANNLRLASAIEQTEDMVLVADTGGVIQYVNQAFCRVTGYAATEVIDQNITILDAGEFKQEIAGEMWRCLAMGKTWKGHFLNRKKDGSFFDVESSISPVKSPDGSVRNYVAVHRDITRQLRMERQLRQAQKMKAIGTLAGGIAHDFNNLLGIILGYTELVLDKIPATDQNHQDLQDVFLAGKRAKDLVAQLLTFSRMSEGERKTIQVVPILKETIQFMRASVPTTIAIHTHILEPDVVISGDPTQLHQVIMNLCTNASFAMEEKGGSLDITLNTVTLTPDEAGTLDVAPGLYALLAVQDTGVGIDPEIRDRLFDPFFSTREIGKGTGLGLSVVHGIVTDAKGAIQVFSEIGRGSTFQVFWPLAVERETASETSTTVHRTLEAYRVLFVDDETSIARLGKMQLEQLGYQVECCSDPGLAWKRLQLDSDQYDVIITDQTMPGMTGIELLSRIATLNAGLPSVLCSGKKDPVSPEQMRTLGIRAVLRKPVLKEELGRILYDIFNNREVWDPDQFVVDSAEAVGP